MFLESVTLLLETRISLKKSQNPRPAAFFDLAELSGRVFSSSYISATVAAFSPMSFNFGTGSSAPGGAGSFSFGAPAAQPAAAAATTTAASGFSFGAPPANTTAPGETVNSSVAAS